MSTQDREHEGRDHQEPETSAPGTDDTDVLGLFGPTADTVPDAAGPTQDAPGRDRDGAAQPGPAPTQELPSWSDHAQAPAAAPGVTPIAVPAPREHAPLRVGTVVWGLMLAAVGFGIVASAYGAELDLQLALISLLGLGGVALLVGSIATARRRNGG
ncbi:hypothetical protein [Cellulomonas chengniuliangii]|uniref:Uncharacterized protein n=1 Tax=Cellulomonas chengniuliangii TaxID=2968084 RepID=A0ABY5KW48_9CELL|nr:hypothetical protein [Cellulomonas chengniuliangii]MCC2309706.1 hypothetical protein [Cellulomonas chengniuliangii]MCC2319002.1 hypothetical protein [Cellulomonas chengniuliangii]UUI74747.1 hypothetical protein NP064_13265 [Cellulomonas chengniuliangii]